WSPTNNDLRTFTVNLSVTDGQGGPATHASHLTVNSAADQAPTLTSLPPVQATINEMYRYQVTATDPDKDPLTYSLPTAPGGMTIDSASGLVSWRPTAAQFGSNAVTVQVSDGRGGTNAQSFTINVVDQVIDHPPVITSTPPLNAIVGQLYT